MQSLSLANFIEKKFPQKKVRFNKYQPSKFLTREEIKPIIKKNPFRMIDGLKRFYKLRKWKSKFIKTSPITNLQKNQQLNIKKNFGIYGSDEIWNFTNPFFGFDPHFFGANELGNKISYAASIGNLDIKQCDKSQLKIISDLLSNFNKISVRDFNSQKFIYSITGENPDIVLDPIHLTSKKDEINLHNINFDQNMKSFLLIYGNFFDEKNVTQIKMYSKKNNLKIISVGYYNYWADINLTSINPSLFLEYIINAKIIFTSMFHGVQYAVKYHKNFWFTSDPYRSNKLNFFIDKLNIRDRSKIEYSKFEEAPDYNKIEKIMVPWCDQSKKFLNDNIKKYSNA